MNAFVLIPNEGESQLVAVNEGEGVFMLLIPERSECRRLVVLVGWVWSEGKEEKRMGFIAFGWWIQPKARLAKDYWAHTTRACGYGVKKRGTKRREKARKGE